MAVKMPYRMHMATVAALCASCIVLMTYYVVYQMEVLTFLCFSQNALVASHNIITFVSLHCTREARRSIRHTWLLSMPCNVLMGALYQILRVHGLLIFCFEISC